MNKNWITSQHNGKCIYIYIKLQEKNQLISHKLLHMNPLKVEPQNQIKAKVWKHHTYWVAMFQILSPWYRDYFLIREWRVARESQTSKSSRKEANRETAMEPPTWRQNLSYKLQTLVHLTWVLPFSPMYATPPAVPVAETANPSISCTHGHMLWFSTLSTNINCFFYIVREVNWKA